jgi:hypothetical protein
MGYRRTLSILLWLAVSACLAVSVFTLVEEMCLATACTDAASFTFFGVGMGWIGIAYFCLILLLLWLRHKVRVVDWAVTAMVYSGVGAEFRLIWIQKYVIGGWCPLCVSISGALFFAAIVLLLERVHEARSGEGPRKEFFGWLVFVAVMMAMGLAIALLGIHALI